MKVRLMRHKKFLDMCLKVTNWFDYGDGIAIKAEWWNMGFVNSFPLGYGYNKRLNLSKTLIGVGGKAHKGYIKDWEMLSGEEVSCLRNGNWCSL